VTVSKTTHKIVQGLRSGYFSPGDVLEACLKLEALALRSDLGEHDLSLAQEATAELQKENARLTEHLRLTKKYLLMDKPIHANP